MGVDKNHPIGSQGGSETHSHNPGTLSAQVSLDGRNTVVRRVHLSSFHSMVMCARSVMSMAVDATWGAAIVGMSDNASSIRRHGANNKR